MSDRNLSHSRSWLVAGVFAAWAVTTAPAAALDSLTAGKDTAPTPVVSTAATAVASGVTASADSPQEGDFTVTRDGISRRYTVQNGVTYRVLEDGTRRRLTTAERREVARHRRNAAQAARHLREQEAHMRRQEAHMREQEAHMREQVAHMRNQITLAADQFSNGARQLREEADRRRDPAHRAREIEKSRRQGETVTDQQLIDSIPQLRQSAEEMEREAVRILATAPQ